MGRGVSVINHSGAGADTLSGFTLGFSESSPSLAILTGSGFASDFTWSTGSAVNTTSISGLNGANHTINTFGTQLRGTLQLTLNQSFTSGMIPIGLTFTNAQRDFFTPIPGSEVTVSGGTLAVSQAGVPEPASLTLMGLATCVAVCLHRRRQRSAQCGQFRSA